MPFPRLPSCDFVTQFTREAFWVVRDLEWRAGLLLTFVLLFLEVASRPESHPVSVLTIIQCAGLFAPQPPHLIPASHPQLPCFQSLPETLAHSLQWHPGCIIWSQSREKRPERNHMRKFLICLSCILLVVLPPLTEVASASDQSKDDDRLRNCGTVLKEILDASDNIPQDLLDKADCVVVFPSVLKAAFI